MKEQLSIQSLKVGDCFEGFLLARTSEQKSSSSGSRYVDMTLADQSGDINAKLWDGAFSPPKMGSVVNVRGLIKEYNGRLQMRVDKLRDVCDKDEVDIRLLTPCAPEEPDAMLAEIRTTMDVLHNEALQKILHVLFQRCGDALMYFPAASKLHHAYRSGLLYHTVCMLRTAKAILPIYPQLDADLLLAGVIAHDLAKISEMTADTMGNVSDYSTEGLLLGHLVSGVSDVRSAAEEAGVSGEYPLLLAHMVISHHGEAEFGSPRPPMFLEAEVLHWLDMMDARINTISGVMKRTVPGTFSERIWSLDRRLYHPLYDRYPKVSVAPQDGAD